jgi:hypothetical protein
LHDLSARERRLASLVVRQDKFLYIAVATLLHLAEEPSVQRKMRKKVRRRTLCAIK